DARGQAVSGQRLAIVPSTGTVAAREITTDGGGSASVVYTAPALTTVVPSGQAVISVTPIGGNFENAAARTVSVLLTGTPNTGAPVPAFSFLPAAPQRLQLVAFDASATTDEGPRCADACTYAWSFGGEGTASGRTATYRFQQARTYAVTLTVTDPTGTSASSTQSVVVVNPIVPTAAFTKSPASPAVLQNVNFVATGSAAAAGHSVVLYEWSFGDGGSSSSTSASTNHAYAAAGTYTVTLTVTDDVGQTGTASADVIVVAGIVANFSISPTNPLTNASVNFNGGDSTTATGASIVEYAWDFGNGSTSTGTSASASSTYTVAGTYTIRLTIRDSAGRTATVTRTVTVTVPAA
ncbi:MAG: PKD domain-containing protein, partial [Vicinamibacterales bacterium]|nr:PKD domain-containing protein [Vicinamibacterales bacterium]